MIFCTKFPGDISESLSKADHRDNPFKHLTPVRPSPRWSRLRTRGRC